MYGRIAVDHVDVVLLVALTSHAAPGHAGVRSTQLNQRWPNRHLERILVGAGSSQEEAGHETSVVWRWIQGLGQNGPRVFKNLV